MKTEYRFKCMISTLTHEEKPNRKEASKLKLPKFNQKRELTIWEMGKLIEAGHSFHASVLDYNLHQNPHDHAGLDRTCFVPHETTLISIDIDHGNYTLTQLKETIRFPHALIYQTHSFTPNKRKWRVLFIANRPIKDEVEFNLVQQGLIFEFAKPFDPNTLPDKVDFSTKDPARLSFGGKKVVDIISQTFDLDELVRTFEEENVLEAIEDFKQAWKEAHPSEKKSTSSTSSHSKKKATKGPNLSKDTVELSELIEGMKPYFPTDLPSVLTVERFLKHLNQVPLHEVLGVGLKETITCLLPDHDDHHPSAVIMENKKGQFHYYCHGCGDGKALSILEFILASQGIDLPTHLVQDTAPVAALLGYELTEDATEVVAYNQHRLEHMTTDLEERVLKRLSQRKLLETYQAFLELAKQRVELKVYSEAGQYCFYLANEYVNQYCRQKGIKGHGKASDTGGKLNRLVHYHLLEKVHFEELTPEIKAHILEKYYDKKGHQVKQMITIYHIPKLDDERLVKVWNQFQYDKDMKLRSTGFGAKQLTTALGTDHAREVFPTTDGSILDKLDKTVIKMVHKTIPVLLSKHHYLTEEMLLVAMDRKGRVKRADKEKRLVRFMTFFIQTHRLVPVRVNKDTKKQYSFPSTLKSNQLVYVQAA